MRVYLKLGRSEFGFGGIDLEQSLLGKEVEVVNSTLTRRSGCRVGMNLGSKFRSH